MALKFAVVPRSKFVDDDIEKDPRYSETNSHNQIINMARVIAEQEGRKLTTDRPVAGWVRDHNGIDEPCRQTTDGARPVWIWWAE